MIVSHLILKNWRNFRSVDVDMGNRVFLVGPNASGKSNLLDVFRFLHDVAKPGGGLQRAIAERGGLSKVRCLAARSHPDIEVEVRLSDYSSSQALWTYGIGIKQEERGYHRPRISYEKVVKQNSVVLNRPDEDDKHDSERLTQTHLEQIIANHPFRDVARFFESVMYLHMIPQLLRQPDAFAGPNLPGDPYGRSFLERVARTPSRTRQSRLKKIEKALRIAVPQLSQLTDTKDETGTPHLEAIYEHWRPKGARQREDQFSDGTLRLLGMLWALLDGDSLLLLEEPELSLNSAIVSRLPNLMYRLQQQRKRQIVLSTHSADLLWDKGIGGDEVLMLLPDVEGTEVVPASSNRQIRDLLEGGLSPADAILPRTAPAAVDQLTLDLFK